MNSLLSLFLLPQGKRLWGVERWAVIEEGNREIAVPESKRQRYLEIEDYFPFRWWEESSFVREGNNDQVYLVGITYLERKMVWILMGLLHRGFGLLDPLRRKLEDQCWYCKIGRNHRLSRIDLGIFGFRSDPVPEQSSQVQYLKSEEIMWGRSTVYAVDRWYIHPFGDCWFACDKR